MAFSILTSARRRIGSPQLGCVALVLLAGSPLAAFALTPADIAPLAGDDFDAKSAAIDKLIVIHDKESLAVLKALSDDSALATDSGAVLLQDGDTDERRAHRQDGRRRRRAAGHAEQSAARESRRARCRACNSTRRTPPRARAAITALLQNPDPSIKPLVDSARAKETDPALKKRLDTLWAMTALHDPDPAKRLEAVQLVAARHDLDMNELLRPLVVKKPDGTFVEADDHVRAAAQSGIDELDAIQRRGQIAGTLFAGLSLGSVLLLAALGLAITYGLIGVINMAHGEFLMIGAYATYVVQNLFQRFAPGAFDWYPLLAVPASFAAAGLVGIVLERLVLKHLYGRPLETLLTTFGVSLILIQATRMIFGAQNVQVINPAWMSGGVTVLPNLILPYNRLAILAFSLIVVAHRVGGADEDAARPVRARRHAEPAHGGLRRREDRTGRFVCVRVRRGHRRAGRLRAVADRQCRTGPGPELHHRFVHGGGARRRRPTRRHGDRRLRARARQQGNRTVLGRRAREDRGAGADRAVHPEASAGHVRPQGP